MMHDEPEPVTLALLDDMETELARSSTVTLAAAPADGLVERLNGVATAIANRILMTHRYPLRNDDIAAIKDAGRRLREAATALASAEARADRLEKDIQRIEYSDGDAQHWRALCHEAIAQAEAANARIAELEAALEPFAAVADEFSDAEDDTFEVWRDFNIPEIREASKLKHFRRARALTGENGHG